METPPILQRIVGADASHEEWAPKRRATSANRHMGTGLDNAKPAAFLASDEAQ